MSVAHRPITQSLVRAARRHHSPCRQAPSVALSPDAAADFDTAGCGSLCTKRPSSQPRGPCQLVRAASCLPRCREIRRRPHLARPIIRISPSLPCHQPSGSPTDHRGHRAGCRKASAAAPPVAPDPRSIIPSSIINRAVRDEGSMLDAIRSPEPAAQKGARALPSLPNIAGRLACRADQAHQGPTLKATAGNSSPLCGAATARSYPDENEPSADSMC